MRLLVDFVDPDGSLCAAAQLAAVDLDPAVTAAVRVVQGGVMLGQPQNGWRKSDPNITFLDRKRTF